MQIKLFGRTGAVGTAEVKESALFYHFTVQIDAPDGTPVRVYAVAGMASAYLGIPSREGRLTVQLARKKLPSAPECAVASAEPRGAWQPWRGTLDGVPVPMALLRGEDGGGTLAMPEETALDFPAWTESFTPVTLFGRTLYALKLDEDRRPILKKMPMEAETATPEPTEREAPQETFSEKADGVEATQEAFSGEADRGETAQEAFTGEADRGEMAQEAFSGEADSQEAFSGEADSQGSGADF